MKISDLIKTVGEDNVKIQSLDNCLISANYSPKKGTVISFGTDAPLTSYGTEEMGVIVWLPRDKVEDALNK